jgi:hypothetical protein
MQLTEDVCTNYKNKKLGNLVLHLLGDTVPDLPKGCVQNAPQYPWHTQSWLRILIWSGSVHMGGCHHYSYQ